MLVSHPPGQHRLLIAAFLISLPASALPPAGLLAHYPLNGDGTDISGNGHHGIANNVLPTSDRFGNPGGATAFNGAWDGSPTGSSVVITDAVFNIGGDYTIGIWFSTDDVIHPHASHPFGWGSQMLFNTDPHTGIGLTYNHNYAPGYIQAFIGPADAFWTVQAAHGPKNDYQAGEWYLATLVKSDHDYSIFIDGELDTTFSVGQNYDHWVGYTFGALLQSGTETFLGALDDAFIYDRALSPSEIQSIFTQPDNAIPESSTVFASFAALALGSFNWALRRRMRQHQ